jgi:hypothetical protein
MNIRVELLAFRVFGALPQIRTVTVPDDEWGPTVYDTNARLELVFQYGQNDFQKRDQRSVSVGDVIELPEEQLSGRPGYYSVDGAGFSRLRPMLYDY